MGSITTFLHETITGNRIVKAFNMEEYEKRRFAEENDKFFRTILKRVRIRALSHPLMEVIGGGGRGRSSSGSVATASFGEN